MAASPRSPTTASSAASATASSPASMSSTAASTISSSRISAARRARCCRPRSIARKTLPSIIEDSFYFLPNVAAIAGTQFLYATRNRQDRFLSNGDQSGATEFNLWSPKAGLLWDIDPTWQAFANISRSAEVPSFGESSSECPGGPSIIPFTSIRPQIATTYEIGTRDEAARLRLGDHGLSRQHPRRAAMPLQPSGNCNVANVDRTVHQGIEAGAGAAIFRGHLRHGKRRTRSG